MQDHSFIDIGKYKDLYKSPFNITIDPTPWYRDWSWSSLFWIIGGVCTVGAVYVCYQSWYDPFYLYNIIKGIPSFSLTGATPPTDVDDIRLGPPSSIGPYVVEKTPSLIDKGKSVSKGFVSVYSYITNKLNPFNWVTSASETRDQFRLFMGVQNDIARADRNYYPFTENNPFNSWFKKLRIHYFGETATELIERLNAKEFAEGVYNEIRVGKGTEIITHASGSGTKIFSAPSSPVVVPNALGIHAGSPTPSQVHPLSPLHPAATSLQLNTLEATSVPTSPIIPNSPSIFADKIEWANAEKPSGEAIDAYIESKRSAFSKSISQGQFIPATKTFSYAQVTQMGTDPLAGVEVHDNRFSVISK